MKKDADEQREQDLEKAREAVMDILRNEELCLRTRNCVCYVDRDIVDGFRKRGIIDLLPSDITFGPYCGGHAENALLKLYRDRTVIENVHDGPIRVSVSYGVHSSRSFSVQKAEKRRKPGNRLDNRDAGANEKRDR